MVTDTAALVFACIAATAALVWAELRKWRYARAVFKIVASTAFVLVALRLGATGSLYGRLILAALILSWAGDVLLLSAQGRLFLVGIACFLLAHVAFAAAFAQLPVSALALVIGLAAMTSVGAVVLRWLWRHLSSFYRVAVAAYVAAIVAMCSLAISISAASGTWPLAVAAIAFAASDISVARDRFVLPGFVNRSWGLPLYYAAQLVIALSVGRN
jgi:uncharacterized membrane protein YhhN